jgi:flavin reductase (DIM6/NTAB) family NADH-FMN oxidoreductase RutF
MHKVIAPKILYLGTPVVLISTMNQDGSVNLAPMSSAWWLGQTGVLGLGTRGQTFANLQRDGDCVLNLPSVDQVAAVDRLALTTGSDPVPDYKLAMNFRHVRNKFDEAGLTSVSSDLVRPPRVMECPIQLEAQVRAIHSVGAAEDYSACIEVQIIRVHAEEELLDAESRHHISPDRWRPLIMSFLSFYGLGDQVHGSRLAEVF